MPDELRGRIQALMPQAKNDLATLVAMKSVADPRQFPAQECQRAAQWVLDAFAELGFVDLELVETADGSQAVSGNRPGPPGAPTVLLYAHYDVQPPLVDEAWHSPPFELTERDGRWYGRGTADCKGNIIMHLTALRALGADVPVHLKLIVEGSEEQGTGGLEAFVPEHVDLLRADAILVCDTGNAAVGQPAVTTTLRGIANVVVTVDALSSEMHSGMYGGAAPDALAALIHMLASLRDEQGNTTVDGLAGNGTWDGEPYPPRRFRTDANVLDGVDLLGDGTVSDALWARPALTVLGIDCPPVIGSAAAIQPRARARLNLRVPPGIDALAAQGALIAHLRSHAPWNVRVDVVPESSGAPFRAVTDGPAYTALGTAMQRAYGQELARLGQGGSIPLCNVFAQTYPNAEIILMGVEEPLTLIHAPNESVAPSEIENMALAEALFLQLFAEQARAANVQAAPAATARSTKSATRPATAQRPARTTARPATAAPAKTTTRPATAKKTGGAGSVRPATVQQATPATDQAATTKASATSGQRATKRTAAATSAGRSTTAKQTVTSRTDPRPSTAKKAAAAPPASAAKTSKAAPGSAAAKPAVAAKAASGLAGAKKAGAVKKAVSAKGAVAVKAASGPAGAKKAGGAQKAGAAQGTSGRPTAGEALSGVALVKASAAKATTGPGATKRTGPTKKAMGPPTTEAAGAANPAKGTVKAAVKAAGQAAKTAGKKAAAGKKVGGAATKRRNGA